MTAGAVEALDQPEADRVASDGKDDRNGRARFLCGARRYHISSRDDGDDALRDKVGGERGKCVIVAVGPALLDAHVAAFNEARLREALAKRVSIETVSGGRGAIEETNERCIGHPGRQWHRCLCPYAKRRRA